MTATDTLTRAIGTPLDRIEAREKVTGQARYAYEYPADEVAYAEAVQAPIARGEIGTVDASEALAQPGVIAVISCQSAPTLARVDDGDTCETACRGFADDCAVGDERRNQRRVEPKSSEKG